MNKSIVKLIIIVMAFLYGTATLVWLVIPPTPKLIEKVIVAEVEQRANKTNEIVREKLKESIRKPIVVADPPKKVDSWIYYVKNVDIDKALKVDADMAIIDVETKNGPITKQQVQKLKDSGKLVLAYLSLGEAEDYRGYWDADWESNDPKWLGEQSRVWKGNYFVKDLMAKQWTDIAEGALSKVKQLGFDGVLIAGISTNPNADRFIERVSIFAKRDNARFKVLIQNYLSKDIVNFVDGIVREGLTYSILGNPNKNVAGEIERLKQFKQQGKPVYVVEFVHDTKKEIARKTILDNGFVGHFAPLELNDVIAQ